MKIALLFPLLMLSTKSFAQFSTSCEAPDDRGVLMFHSGIPGCTEKDRTQFKDGEKFSYTQKFMQKKADGTVSPVEVTQAYSYKLKDGKAVEVTHAMGDDVDKAQVQNVTQLETDPATGKSRTSREILVLKTGGTDNRYVTYDRNLCAKLDQAGLDQKNMAGLKVCNDFIQKYEVAVNESIAALANEDLKLGLTDQKTNKVRSLAPTNFSDMMNMVGTCGFAVHGHNYIYETADPAKFLNDAVKTPGPVVK
jgi:hypothetical protein